MDIKIEAQKKYNYADQINYISDSLSKKYKRYPYINDVLVNISEKENNQVAVSLQIKPEKGKQLFSQGEAPNVKTAFNLAFKKMNTQIEKYKAVHYSSSHTNVAKSNNLK